MTVADSAENGGRRIFFCPSRCAIHQYGIEHFGLISDNSTMGHPIVAILVGPA